MFKVDYNPDVLSCLANLSNDEVFTPPALANEILDMLPKELWSNKEITFLDPVSKSGVFLREIAKRLIVGLEDEIPDMQIRVNHILKNQLFGIAITELTSLLSRRSLYCSKTANGKYSICNEFDTESGNILFDKIQHTWKNGKCVNCGASQAEYDRDDVLETHAYHFIHTDKPEEIFNMKFDVIIGNPPYQLNDGGAGASAIPLYNKFVETAKKLNPKFISMIIPSRWFAGGKGLDNFREEMLNDKRISFINDFINAKECFPGVSLGGGVCYFLWDKDYDDDCMVVNTKDGQTQRLKRKLNEHDVFVRNNKAVSIINKIFINKNISSVKDMIKPRNPFGFSSSYRGDTTDKNSNITLHSSDGISYLSMDDYKKGMKKGISYFDKFKIMFSKVTSEHAGEPDKSGKFRVLSTVKVLPRKHICTDSYLILGPFTNKEDAEDFLVYMKTKFFRFLLLQGVTSINLSKSKFQFVPQLSNYNISDDLLYKQFNLSKEEINEIECTIKHHD